MVYVPHPTLPSVSAILAVCGLTADYASIPEAVLKAASARGSAVHEAIELHHYGCLDLADVPDNARGYLKGYERFLEETRHIPIVSEMEVVSARWGVVGHIDRVGWQAAERAVIDFKTTAEIHVKPVAYQLAAYEMLWNEARPNELIAKTLCVQLKRDGTYRVLSIDTKAVLPGDLVPPTAVFQSAIIIYHAKTKGRAA